MRTSFSETQDYILGNSQPSPSTSSGQALRDLIMLLPFTQDDVLGYSQPELSKLASKSGLACR